MSLQDKLQDVKLTVQNDRKLWAIGGFIVLVLVVFMFTNDQNHRGHSRDVATSTAPVENMIGQNTVYKDLITTLQLSLDENASRTTKITEALERIETSTESFKTKTEGTIGQLISEMEAMNDEIVRMKKDIGNRQTIQFSESGDVSISEPEKLNPIWEVSTELPLKPKPPQPQRMTIITPGDAVPVQLLTGVNAPVDGTPYPVVFKLDGAIMGPDGSALDLGEARIVAAALGSEVDARVLYRLTNLAIRHKDGRRSVVEIDGWIVGEDGIRGMQGRLIDKLGELIIATATASTAAALANHIAGNGDLVVEDGGDDNLQLTSNSVENAVGKGINESTQKLVDVLIDRYEKLVPVVEVLSGRRAVAVFSQPSEISPCVDEECGGDETIYASLD